MTQTKIKPKACKACGTEFTPFVSTAVACSTKCALDHAEGKRIAKEKREKAKSLREFNRETKRRKEKIKPRGEWQKEAQREFNKFIRWRDFGQPCISCGKSHEEVEQDQGWKTGGAWDCGHFLGVGAFPELRFNEMNAHRQCKGCNSGSHNHVKKARTVSQDYRVNLIEKIGITLVFWLEGPHTPLKPTIEELKWLKGYYRKAAKEAQAYMQGDI